MNQFFATCAKGLEDLLQDEINIIAGQAGDTVTATLSRGGVTFTSTVACAYRICMWSRVASRILLNLHDFSVDDDDELYDVVGSIDWSMHFDVGDSLAIDCFSAHSKLNNSHYAMLRAKDAVVDQFQQAVGDRPHIEKDNPDIRLNLYLHDNGCCIYLDLSGEALHKRGYRQRSTSAPLRETLAAGLLYRSKWPEFYAEGNPFYDPMCGSGTLLIEAAMMASDIAPGLAREQFGFHGWKQHEESVWDAVVLDAEQRKTSGLERCPTVIGCDNDERAITASRSNIDAAGLQDKIAVYMQDATEPVKKNVSKAIAGQVGLIVCNPPYGKRLGEQQALRTTYMRFGKQLRTSFCGWVVAMITSEPVLARSIGLRAFKKNSFFNGPLKSILYQYRIDDRRQPGSTTESSADKPVSVAEPEAGDKTPVGDADGDRGTPQHAQMFRNRLQKNYKHLKKWARKNDVECYRVYDADIPQYAVAIDLYADWVHVQEYRAPKSVDQNLAFQRVNDVLDVVADVLQTTQDKVVLKVRQKQSGAAQYQKHGDANRRISVHEGGLEFLVNLHDYLDTGLFLDHRQTRQIVRDLSRGKSFLNLFAYTGSVSVYAAAGGAGSTTTVDMSNTYLNWAKQNMMTNGFVGALHDYINEDCTKWLGRAIDEQKRYGLIFMDPPTFSNSKSMDTTLDVIRDHAALISGCMALLEDDGVLIFSSNAKGFSLDADVEEMCYLREITSLTTTEDFRRKPLHRCWLMAKQEALLKLVR